MNATGHSPLRHGVSDASRSALWTSTNIYMYVVRTHRWSQNAAPMFAADFTVPDTIASQNPGRCFMRGVLPEDVIFTEQYWTLDAN